MTVEDQLRVRAEELADLADIADAVREIIAGAEGAGADRAAVLPGLAAALHILDDAAGPVTYNPGTAQDRHPGTGYASDAELLEALSDAEDDIRERARETSQCQDRVVHALDTAIAGLAAARQALAVAYAMPVDDPCDGCHSRKQAAIDAAQTAVNGAERRIRVCEDAAEILDALAGRLVQALQRLRQVPGDLGDVYELVYAFIRRGGKLPRYARFIEGEDARV